MAHETNPVDLSDAEKGMCAPAPTSPGHPDTKSNTTTLIDLGDAEKDYDSAATDVQTVEEIMLLQKLESAREKRRQFVEDSVLRMQALLLKDLPSSCYFDRDAILQLKSWLLDNLNSPSLSNEDVVVQMKAMLSEALEHSDEDKRRRAELLEDLPWVIAMMGYATWMLSALLHEPFEFKWYDAIIMGLFYISQQVHCLVYKPRKKHLTWFDKLDIRTAPFFIAFWVFMIIYVIVSHFIWHTSP
ncbi:hypothetical protein PG996_015465 [Apiospora saccharicola]|uniref:Uncharacterized protein n=1 Tax=Apiospora saccharicola TaxID=335842 RepID=A0ABR1TL65_9PEZI